MRSLLSVLCIIVFLPTLANAHVEFEPPWASDEGTTLQEWTFDDDDNPAPPENIRNEYGEAAALITVGDLGEGWLHSLPGLGTQTGLWDLGSGGTIVLEIDNRDEPLPYKEIWLQVTYYMDISQPPIVDVPGATFLGGETVIVEESGIGGWYLDLSKWRMEPNPSHETIILTADPSWGAVIDQIVVNTICIPEPVSLGLLAFGSLLFLRKRR